MKRLMIGSSIQRMRLSMEFCTLMNSTIIMEYKHG